MNNSRIILQVLNAIILLLIVTGTIRLASRPFRKITEVPYKESTTFTIWHLGIATMLALTFIPVTTVIIELIDAIYGYTALTNTPADIKKAFTQGLTTSLTLFITGATWFWTCHISGNYISKSIIGKTTVVTEMELDNKAYFMTRFILILVCMIILLPFYLSLLRYFLPASNIPFYR